MSSIMQRLHDSNAFCTVSYDQIEPGLYLGSLSAAKDIDTLNKLKVSHILTIDTCVLPRNIVELPHIKTEFIKLSDQPKEDLLSHFDSAIEFIETGLKHGSVLVHCYFGMSRSATVVIAYVMKKYRLSYSEALQMVKAKRKVVHPNDGFVAQLKLYKDMEWTINRNNMKYKLFQLNLAGSQVRVAGILPRNFHFLIQPDPGVTQSKPDPNVFRCRKCRRVLASASNLIEHHHDRKPCTKTLFIEPIAWMNVAQECFIVLLSEKKRKQTGCLAETDRL
ncbi:hypothetical protein YQE_10642, partial [Dendroctonus ponderosae]